MTAHTRWTQDYAVTRYRIRNVHEEGPCPFCGTTAFAPEVGQHAYAVFAYVGPDSAQEVSDWPTEAGFCSAQCAESWGAERFEGGAL